MPSPPTETIYRLELKPLRHGKTSDIFHYFPTCSDKSILATRKILEPWPLDRRERHRPWVGLRKTIFFTLPGQPRGLNLWCFVAFCSYPRVFLPRYPFTSENVQTCAHNSKMDLCEGVPRFTHYTIHRLSMSIFVLPNFKLQFVGPILRQLYHMSHEKIQYPYPTSLYLYWFATIFPYTS